MEAALRTVYAVVSGEEMPRLQYTVRGPVVCAELLSTVAELSSINE